MISLLLLELPVALLQLFARLGERRKQARDLLGGTGQFFLFDGQGLTELPLFRLDLLKLLLVAALIEIPLFLNRGPIVFQGVTGMLMLVLQGGNLGLLILHLFFQVADALLLCPALGLLRGRGLQRTE